MTRQSRHAERSGDDGSKFKILRTMDQGRQLVAGKAPSREGLPLRDSLDAKPGAGKAPGLSQIGRLALGRQITITGFAPTVQVGFAATIALARERFRYLTASGIQSRRDIPGPDITGSDLSAALQALCRCRCTKRPSTYSDELQRAVTRWAGGRRVSVGAAIAAAVVLGFEVRGWYGVKAYYPDALLNVSRNDVRKLGRAQ